MPYYEATIHHDEKTFEKLAHMQYDLFCKGNRYSRTALSGVLILVGIFNTESWWAFPLIGYGWYLNSSTYAAANHTARKLSRGIKEAKLKFPASRYEFTDEGMVINTLPEDKPFGEPLLYENFRRMGEDPEYFYIFRDERGGYMIPKTEIPDEDAFRAFLERRSGKKVESRMAPIVRLIRKMRNKQREPYHL